MKLHLTRSLRAALVACVGGAVTASAWGETTIDLGGTSYTADILVEDDVQVTGSGRLGNDTNTDGQSVNNAGALTFDVTGTVEVGAWNTSAQDYSPTQIGSNVTDITFAGGTTYLTCKSTIANSGSLTINSGAGFGMNLYTSVTVNSVITNNGTLTLDGGTMTLASGVLDTLSYTEATGYSDGENGYYGASRIYTLVTGAGVIKGTATVYVSDDESHTLQEDGTFTVVNGSDGIYYVNTGTVENPDLSEAASVKVAAGAVVKFSGKDCTTAVTLAGKDSTLWLRGGSAASSQNVVSVTLDGGQDVNHIIKGDQTSVRTNVTGTGDLTLQNTGSTFLLKGAVNNTGDVTILGSVEMMSEGGDAIGSFGSNVQDIDVQGTLTVNSGTTLGNSGTVKVATVGAVLAINSNATVSSDISVSNGGKVDVGTTLTMGASGISVGTDGTLDLKDTQTLTLESLDLAAGTTIVLGKDTRITITDALTINNGVIFDVSSWCDYDSFSPYELITYTGTGDFNPILPEYVTIKTSTGDNEKAYLTVSGNSVTLVPEPTTATLSLLALAGLAARRRRK